MSSGNGSVKQLQNVLMPNAHHIIMNAQHIIEGAHRIMIHGHHIKIKARYILIQTRNELSFAKIRQSRRSINLHEIAPPPPQVSGQTGMVWIHIMSVFER